MVGKDDRRNEYIHIPELKVSVLISVINSDSYEFNQGAKVTLPNTESVRHSMNLRQVRTTDYRSVFKSWWMWCLC